MRWRLQVEHAELHADGLPMAPGELPTALGDYCRYTPVTAKVKKRFGFRHDGNANGHFWGGGPDLGMDGKAEEEKAAAPESAPVLNTCARKVAPVPVPSRTFLLILNGSKANSPPGSRCTSSSTLAVFAGP